MVKELHIINKRVHEYFTGGKKLEWHSLRHRSDKIQRLSVSSLIPNIDTFIRENQSQLYPKEDIKKRRRKV